MTFGLFNPLTNQMQQQGQMQQPALLRALMTSGGMQGGAAPQQELPVIPPLSDVPGTTSPPTDPAPTTSPSTLTNRDMIQMMFGPGDLQGTDADVFLGNLLGNDKFRSAIEQGWGGSLDDPWSRDSDLWKNLQVQMRKIRGVGPRDFTGGSPGAGGQGGGSPGGTGDAGQGGSDV